MHKTGQQRVSCGAPAGQLPQHRLAGALRRRTGKRDAPPAQPPLCRRGPLPERPCATKQDAYSPFVLSRQNHRATCLMVVVRAMLRELRATCSGGEFHLLRGSARRCSTRNTASAAEDSAPNHDRREAHKRGHDRGVSCRVGIFAGQRRSCYSTVTVPGRCLPE